MRSYTPDYAFFPLMRLMSLCGSLRAASSNAAALEALRLLAPAGVEVRPWQGLDRLPHFNPDLDGELAAQTPPPVADLRRAVGECWARVC